jgi:hypothetical protein
MSKKNFTETRLVYYWLTVRIDSIGSEMSKKFPDPSKLAKDFAKLRVGGSKKKDETQKSNLTEAPLRHYNSLAVSKIQKDQKKEEVNFDDVQTVKEVVKDPTYKAEKVIGTGSFGTGFLSFFFLNFKVYLAKVNETGETVAIKKVLQDKRFKVFQKIHLLTTPKEQRITNYENCQTSKHCPSGKLFLFQWTKKG